MTTMTKRTGAPLAFNHISVDCVVLGFDGDNLKVVLIKPKHDEVAGMSNRKLPGGLIYMDENLDDAAARVLNELTGMNKVSMVQFKAFGSKDRTKNPRDVLWLERVVQSKIDHIITIGYLATVEISGKWSKQLAAHDASWVEVGQEGELAFDHNVILREAVQYFRYLVGMDLSYLFALLPAKFTVAQFRNLLGLVKGKVYDVKNFHKKLPQMPYLVALDEREMGVAHRAAKYYRFDKKLYNKLRG